jgi:hypothetical protein
MRSLPSALQRAADDAARPQDDGGASGGAPSGHVRVARPRGMGTKIAAVGGAAAGAATAAASPAKPAA